MTLSEQVNSIAWAFSDIERRASIEDIAKQIKKLEQQVDQTKLNREVFETLECMVVNHYRDEFVDETWWEAARKLVKR